VSEELFRRDPHTFVGSVETRPFTSTCLRGNALADPYEREVPVYVPPHSQGERFPVVFLLAGLTGRAHSLLETHPWKRGVVLEYDRAVASGTVARAILVLPDCFTRYGGSQYVDSTAVGNYETYVARELTQFVDDNYPTLPRRAVAGKSSGGFGALHLAMQHPGTFAVAVSISGDCNFDYVYGNDFLPALRGLLPFGSDPAQFLTEFERTHELSGDGHAVLGLLAMSACYSPNPASALGFDLPLDLRTGRRDEAVWKRWLAFDPVHACARHKAALEQLDWLYLEAGQRDEFHLQFGLRVLVDELTRLGIPHEHHEHERGHFDLNDRYLALLPRIIAALADR
jgi:S-formylglutathione hydrolase FrmB